MTNNSTSCVLQHTRLELTSKTPINNYGSVWWWRQKLPVSLINTGLCVNLKDKEIVQALKRHPYEIQMLDVVKIMEDIQDLGTSFIQVITEVIEPKETSVKELQTLLAMTKEVDLSLPIRFKDIISNKTYQMISLSKNQINILEVK